MPTARLRIAAGLSAFLRRCPCVGARRNSPLSVATPVLALVVIQAFALIISPAIAAAQETTFATIAPPSAIQATDRPNDAGGAIVLIWTGSPDDRGIAGPVTGYEIMRAHHPEGSYELRGRTDAGTIRFVDSAAETGTPYFYKVAAVAGQVVAVSQPVGPVASSAQWLNRGRLNLLVLGLILMGTLIYSIRSAQQGKLPRIRELTGITAIEEAIDHAADSGRPVFFVTGSEDLYDIQTIAGLSVLEQVAQRTAVQEADLFVPQLHSLVMAASDDTLRRAYATAGRPASYDRDSNFYVSDEQFGFVAGVSGDICRAKPAAFFYFGSFYAEALALAEVGQTVGARQVAGTGQASQIPFLLTACDDVLIGEELFAASAYLSGDPRQLGSIRGQDLGKLLAIGAIVTGCLLATLATVTGSGALASLRDAFLSVFQSG